MNRLPITWNSMTTYLFFFLGTDAWNVLMSTLLQIYARCVCWHLYKLFVTFVSKLKILPPQINFVFLFLQIFTNLKYVFVRIVLPSHDSVLSLKWFWSYCHLNIVGRPHSFQLREQIKSSISNFCVRVFVMDPLLITISVIFILAYFGTIFFFKHVLLKYM
jgi:hypothetical protein